MSSQEVMNPKSEILPDEKRFNDRDRLNDLLISIKHITYMYSLACQEASNNELYTKLFSLFQESSQLQRKTYDLMFEKGWYKLEKEQAQKIDTKHQTFKSEESQLS